jgi:hypothetical protein
MPIRPDDPPSCLSHAMPAPSAHRWAPTGGNLYVWNAWRTIPSHTARDRTREGQPRDPIASITSPCLAGARSWGPPVSNDRSHPSPDARIRRSRSLPVRKRNENLIDRRGCPPVVHAYRIPVASPPTRWASDRSMLKAWQAQTSDPELQAAQTSICQNLKPVAWPDHRRRSTAAHHAPAAIMSRRAQASRRSCWSRARPARETSCLCNQLEFVRHSCSCYVLLLLIAARGRHDQRAAGMPEASRRMRPIG